MKQLLNLRDLQINGLNYRKKAVGIRQWLLASLEYYPCSLRSISKKTEIEYQTLLRFVHKKTKHMSLETTLKLRDYIRSLMIVDYERDLDVNLEVKQFFKA